MTNDAERNGAVVSQLAQDAAVLPPDTSLSDKDMTTDDTDRLGRNGRGISLFAQALAAFTDTSLSDKDRTEADAEKDAAWEREYLENIRSGRYLSGALAKRAYKGGGERGPLLYGTHREYLLHRLALVRPDLWERVWNRELPARAAAIEAGIIYKPPAEEARLEALVTAWAKARLEDRLAFLWLVEDEIAAAENGEYLNEVTTRGRRRPYRLKDEAKKVPEVEVLLESGLAANDLARQLGVSYRTLCRWRFGHTKPSQAHKDKLAQLVAELEDEPRQAG